MKEVGSEVLGINEEQKLKRGYPFSMERTDKPKAIFVEFLLFSQVQKE